MTDQRTAHQESLETPETFYSGTIEVSVRNVYGTDKVYPACYKGKLIAEIAGTTTLTASTLTNLKMLGYIIKVRPTTLEI